MQDADDEAEDKLIAFVVERTNLPPQRVRSIYAFGHPWRGDIASLEEQTARDALETGVPLESTYDAVAQLLAMEAQGLRMKLEKAQEAVDRGEPFELIPEFEERQAEDVERLDRLALLTGESRETVEAVSRAILTYVFYHTR